MKQWANWLVWNQETSRQNWLNKQPIANKKHERANERKNENGDGGTDKWMKCQLVQKCFISVQLTLRQFRTDSTVFRFSPRTMTWLPWITWNANKWKWWLPNTCKNNIIIMNRTTAQHLSYIMTWQGLGESWGLTRVWWIYGNPSNMANLLRIVRM